jgi:hypothetical protein
MTEILYEIENQKLTAHELDVLAFIAGDCEGVFQCDDVDYTLRETLDMLVLSGFVIREMENGCWINTWSVTDEMLKSLEPYVSSIMLTVSSIGEA